MLLRAFAMLRRRRPARLLILGEGPSENDWRFWPPSWGLRPICRCLASRRIPMPRWPARLLVLSSDL